MTARTTSVTLDAGFVAGLTAILEGTTVSLTKEAADLLNKTYNVTALTEFFKGGRGQGHRQNQGTAQHPPRRPPPRGWPVARRG